MRSGRQGGHAVEASREISLNESGMSANAWVNLSGVTGKLITLPLEWEKQAVALVTFWESGEFCELRPFSLPGDVFKDDGEYRPLCRFIAGTQFKAFVLTAPEPVAIGRIGACAKHKLHSSEHACDHDAPLRRSGQVHAHVRVLPGCPRRQRALVPVHTGVSGLM